MSILYFELIYKLIPLFLSIAVITLFFFINYLHRKTKVQHRQLAQLNEELSALLSCSRGISERLHNYQRQFHNITERQDKLEVGDTGSATDYKQAAALFNRGATEDEMLSTCDLSRGEINLIAHLQKAKTRNNSQRY